jgi:4-amino-4-deoxy-L-arabinose transferase-like glycosyltransferase
MAHAAVPQETGVITALRTRHTWVRAAIPAVLLILYVAQCLWFIRTQSLTYDEPQHIALGLEAWRDGRFQKFIQTPPLARLWCTLPLLSRKWQMNLEFLPAGFRLHGVQPDVMALTSRARAMNLGLGVLLGLLLWLTATKLFSDGAANFVLALFAFCPSLIAHFSLATTDGAATLLVFAAAVQLVRWKNAPRWKATLICGVVLGLLLLTKMSTLPMFGLAVLWMLVLVSNRVSCNPRNWNWGKATAAVVVAFVIFWSGYFFHLSRLTIREGTLTATFPNWTTEIVKPTHSRLNISLPVPAGEYVAGFRDLAFVNAHGQPAFFLGHVSLKGGWKTYFPVAILLKWPLVLIALAATGILLVLTRRIKLPADLWILSSFPAFYLLLAVFARLNYGERHVLPVYPFALLFAAAVWQKFSQNGLGRFVFLTLVALNAADVLRYAPDYLSYFQICVPPSTSYRLLSDSNLDWGQGLLALRKYELEHPNEQLSLAYFGSVDPAVYGVRARTLAEDAQATGTVVIGATNLSGQFLKNPDAYHWLFHHKLKGILDHCMYVFEVTK